MSETAALDELQARSKARIEALAAAGGQGWNPVQLAFLSALERRCGALSGPARQRGLARLTQAVDSTQAAFARDREAARQRLAARPQAAPALEALLQAGEFRALEQQLAASAASPSPLAELLARLNGLPDTRPQAGPALPDAGPAPQPELKSLQHFQGNWSALSLEQQLTRAIQSLPENAGPFNSQYLLVQALRWMRDQTPAYLRHFIPYAETLMHLDQLDAGRNPPPRKPADGERRRRSSRRG